jgi:catechol 2,3-dioxygenase-like lactoylglutathione lyase family enzyme
MRMRGLNHVNLVVSDVEASARFYEELFGMERVYRVGEFVFLSCGDTDLGFVKGTPMIHRRFHIGFRVDSRDEVDGWLVAVNKFGAPVTHGPKDYGDYYTFTCRDPDGYGVEIYCEPGPRGRTVPPEET